ncbi:serine/threonine-protein kinase [Nonomuraea sp. NPDC000554]|uniref:serine/threonine-protein kinase n=1 Tax=Nonomuraea sp. NPDC000554 TaxID=3154259 RepID=UPI0033285965
MERGELIAGRYELVKRLGRGGMGEVWAGRDRTLYRDVALKLLVLDEAALPELTLRFEREAVAAAQINHPNVVILHDRGVHEDMLFLVMEKVDGATLTEHIRADAPMALAQALAIADGICAALIAAHRTGVVHYDIKPHNVMLTSEGQVKVVDFGIAGFLQTAFTVARSSQLTPAGTPEYGAPEQFLTERGDERSDLYALGGVLFAMLTGRPPFTGHHGLAVIRRKLDEDAPRLDSLRPGLPPALTELVAELLDRDPARRPDSAHQVRDRLRDLRTARADTVPMPGSGGPGDTGGAVVDDGLDHGAHDSWRTRTATDERGVVGQPPHTRAVAPTRRMPEPDGSFDMSWTGKEPLSAYADRTRPSGVWKTWAIWAAALGLAAAVCIYLPLQGHRLSLQTDAGDELTGWGYLLAFGLLLAMGSIAPCAINAIYAAYSEMKTARPHGDRDAWTLHVGPNHIVTNGTTGRREFTWDQIQRITIEPIRGKGAGREPYMYNGLHLEHAPGNDRRPTELCPAGWPHHEPATIAARKDGRFPICVLGPMTKEQQTALTEALARHGGRRWSPSSAPVSRDP